MGDLIESCNRAEYSPVHELQRRVKLALCGSGILHLRVEHCQGIMCGRLGHLGACWSEVAAFRGMENQVLGSEALRQQPILVLSREKLPSVRCDAMQGLGEAGLGQRGASAAAQRIPGHAAPTQ